MDQLHAEHLFAQQKMLAAADGPADAPAPQPVHAQMKRKHRSKSSRSKHAQRGTERGYTQVARDAVRIAGMIEDLDDWQGENARESRRLQKRRGQVAAQIHVVNCRGRALADKEGQSTLRTEWLPLLRDSTSRTRAPENSFPR